MLSISGLKIESLLEESNQSIIFRAHRLDTQEPVIVKTLKDPYPSSESLVRFQREWEILRSLQLPGVVKVYEFGILNPSVAPTLRERPAMVLEDFGGESLAKLKLAGNLKIEEFLNLAIAMSEIIASIHTANIIHKDINPSNIIYNPQTRQLKLIDFGIATCLTQENPSLKNPSLLQGTLAYISPEKTGRINRVLDYRSDFYSFGVTLYNLLTGKLPFETSDILELVHCHLAKQPPSPHQLNPEIPAAISNIIMKLMAKTPEERYQSLSGLKADLETCLHSWQNYGKISDVVLGKKDIYQTFHIPQKLYGREAEIQSILSAFERGTAQSTPSTILTNRPVEIMLVGGYSGIGKSSLVRELYKPITQKRGYFIAGKFDQLQRHIPYSALLNAFKNLIINLLSETPEQLNQWREKLLKSLAVNAQVIIDVLPEIELIIGKQKLVPELGGIESQNRFNLVFKNFINCFCSQQHPLVIFLDDLQWADSGSLKLIELMGTDSSLQNLFLICAYRDNEVSPTHPFSLLIEKLRQQGAHVNQISLAPLGLEPVRQLIADTFGQDIDSVNTLAQLVIQKTGGNPFFINQFIRLLVENNLIFFNKTTAKWEWDISNINSSYITENVVEIMILHLKKLNSETQEQLKFAACIGANFDLNTLAKLANKSPRDIALKLHPAIEAGLIIPLGELDEQLLIQKYKFAHDRIQQATSTLIKESQKAALHLKIGRQLLQNTPAQQISELIFEITDRLNLGISLVKNPKEKNQIARLNLMAGKKAKAAIAYEFALKYLTAGIQLLPPQSWQSDYDLTRQLYESAVEASYLSGNFESMESLAQEVLQASINLTDKIKVYEIIIEAYSVCNQQLQAINIGLEVLQMLGVDIPENPTPLDLQQKYQKLQELLPAKTIEDLVNLPPMTDAKKLAAMRIMCSIVPAIYQSKPVLFPILACEQVNLSLTYGNCTFSISGYADYGVLLAGAFFEFEAAYQFGKLALTMLSKFKANEVKSQTYFKVAAFTRHGKEHISNILSLLEEGYQSGLELGDLAHSGYSLTVKIIYSFFCGKTLADIHKEIDIANHNIKQIKQETVLKWNHIFQQLVLTLRGSSDNYYSLITDTKLNDICLPIQLPENNHMGLHLLFLSDLILSYSFKNFPRAFISACRAQEYLDGAIGFLVIPIFYFYYSLTCLAIYPTSSTSEQENLLDQVVNNQAKLQIFANSAPRNFQHKYELIEAEKARVLSQVLEAMDAYERAIKGAMENGFIQDEALAWELAGEFYLARGMDRIAQTYLEEAHYSYTRWQATAKVKDLETRYPHLLTKVAIQSRRSQTTINHTTLSTSTSRDLLDLASVIKASQTISSEIEFDKLLSKLMKIVIEAAGAQVAYLIVPSENEYSEAEKWMLEAQSSVDEEAVALHPDISLENTLCVALLNYVAHTQESVVLNNAVVEGNFTNDYYIIAKQAKSILCTPLLNQGHLIGILYLENNLVTAAFTPERLEILKSLSSQAAISLQNAKLYADLHTKEKELTQLLETVPVGVCLHQADATVTYMNQTGKRLLKQEDVPEASQEQLASAYRLYIADTDELYPTHLLPALQALQGKQVYLDDLELRAGDQRTLLEVIAVPVFDSQAKITGSLTVFQDITERQQAQKLLADYNRHLEAEVRERTEALRQSEQRFKNAFETAAIGICIVSVPGNILEVNASLCQMFGYSPTEFLSITFNKISHPDDVAAESNLMQQLLTGAIPYYHLEKRYLNKKKHLIWGSISVSLVRDIQQQPLYFIAQIQDITQRKYAEESLRRSELSLRKAQQLGHIGSWEFNCLTKKTTWTEEVYHIHGLDPSQRAVNPSEIGKYIYPEDLPIYQKFVVDFAVAGKPFETDLRILHSSGEIRYVEIRGEPVFNQTGEMIGLIGTTLDITERKRAEIALLDSLQREKALFQVLQRMRQTLDIETIFSATTDELRRVLKSDRVLIYHCKSDNKVLVVAESLASGFQPFMQENNNIINLNQINLELGNPAIKSSKNSEKISSITDLEETWNSRITSNNNYLGISDINQANFDTCQLNFLETLQAKSYLIVPIWCGNTLWGLLASYQNYAPYQPKESEINMVVQIGIQLGVALQQAELLEQTQQQSEALQKAVIAADAANKAKSSFLANMSHELRTPLNAILGFSQLTLHSENLSSEDRKHLNIINRNGSHLLRLINDVLDMAKIEAGRMTLNENNFNLYFLLDDLENLFRLKAQQKKLHLLFFRCSDVPELVRGDEIKLRQVLINLLGNAIKFTQNGNISLNVTVKEKKPSSTYQILFQVSDTGPGIAASEINKLFQPFQQTKSGQSLQEGTGLGLSISRAFVHLMGGEITATSQEGLGSTFSFYINILPVNLADTHHQTTSRPISLYPNGPYRILIVDDIWDNRQLLVKLLSPLNFEIQQASNGQETIQIWEQWQPQLIFMDMRMPIIDGYETTQHIKASVHKSIPIIIAITASSLEEERLACLLAGCDDFISKPFAEPEIFQIISRYLKVSFIYEQNTDNSPNNPSPEIEITRQDMAQFPPAWLDSLHQASRKGDLDFVLSLIDEIRDQNPSIAHTLTFLTDNFEVTKLLDLTKPEAGEEDW